MLFLTLAFKSPEAVTLADGCLEPSKGQNHQTEPDHEATGFFVEATIEVEWGSPRAVSPHSSLDVPVLWPVLSSLQVGNHKSLSKDVITC